MREVELEGETKKTNEKSKERPRIYVNIQLASLTCLYFTTQQHFNNNNTFNWKIVSYTSYRRANFLARQPPPCLRAGVLSDGDRLYLKRSLQLIRLLTPTSI